MRSPPRRAASLWCPRGLETHLAGSASAIFMHDSATQLSEASWQLPSLQKLVTLPETWIQRSSLISLEVFFEKISCDWCHMYIDSVPRGWDRHWDIVYRNSALVPILSSSLFLTLGTGLPQGLLPCFSFHSILCPGAHWSPRPPKLHWLQNEFKENSTGDMPLATHCPMSEGRKLFDSVLLNELLCHLWQNHTSSFSEVYTLLLTYIMTLKKVFFLSLSSYICNLGLSFLPMLTYNFSLSFSVFFLQRAIQSSYLLGIQTFF